MKILLYFFRVPWFFLRPAPITKKSRRKSNLGLWFYLGYFSRLVIFVFVVDLLYLAFIWPDWSELKKWKIPKSAFIAKYQKTVRKNRRLPRLRWKPVSRTLIAKSLFHAVIVAEDSRFYSHSGIDIKAISDAMNYNISNLKFKYGASTISQQTTKNMYLSKSRNPLRKWHEIILTLGMEKHLSKAQILNLYVNIAELGKGIYGAEAASRYYWQKSASALTPLQASELAATLPSPKKHNPKTRTRTFLRRASKIYRFMVISNPNTPRHQSVKIHPRNNRR